MNRHSGPRNQHRRLDQALKHVSFRKVRQYETADRVPQQHARVAAGSGLNHMDNMILHLCKHRIRLERTHKKYLYDGFKVGISRI